MEAEERRAGVKSKGTSIWGDVGDCFLAIRKATPLRPLSYTCLTAFAFSIGERVALETIKLTQTVVTVTAQTVSTATRRCSRCCACGDTTPQLSHQNLALTKPTIPASKARMGLWVTLKSKSHDHRIRQCVTILPLALPQTFLGKLPSQTRNREPPSRRPSPWAK